MTHTILFLAANPLDTSQRALDREAHAIQTELERSGFGDRFELVTRWAVEPLDLLHELRKLRPAIVHFSGHTSPRARDGAAENGGSAARQQPGLLFESQGGRARRVPTDALDAAFKATGSSVKLVVLSACYSEQQAAALLTHVDCVIGMRGSIDDDAARSFAIGLYGGLAERESVAAAYEQGCTAIRLEGLSGADHPRLKTRTGVDATRIILASVPIADLLRACQAAMPGDLRAMTRQKYTHTLYVPRAATAALVDVESFEERFRIEVGETLVRLKDIARSYPLPGAEVAIEQASIVLLRGLVHVDLERAVELLMDAFHARTIERALAEVQMAVRVQNFPELDAAMSRIRAILKPFPLRVSIEDFMDGVREAARVHVASGDTRFGAVLQLFPGDGPSSAPNVVSEILGTLRASCERFRHRATALVGAAGMGKTNALCALAETLGQRLPVLFVEGHADLGDEARLALAVQRTVEAAVGGAVPDWRDALRTALDGPSRWLVLCIDGIEESTDLARAARAIDQFLGRCEDLRIHVVVSCRDIAWETFHDRLQPFLVGGRQVRLDAFTDDEWSAASRLYLERFGIRCTFGPDAQAVLRHPLLLRLFCEAHRGAHLEGVTDLRPLDVFEHYFDGATRRAAERSGAVRPASAVALLERIAAAIWQARGAVSPSAVGLTFDDLGRQDSLYNQLRSEGVLAESQCLAASDAGVAEDVLAAVASGSAIPNVAIHFVYSQVAEFLIARQWARALGASPTTDVPPGVLAAAADALTSFPQAIGVIVFLDRLRSAGGRLVSRFLHLLVERGDDTVTQLQAVIPYAFDHVAVQDIDPSVIAALVRLEAVARPEIREALAPGMLRLIAARRDAPELRGLAARILGVPLEEIVHPPVLAKESSEAPALPAPRYHYRYETRLSALRILAGQGSEPAIDMVVRGIRQLGQQDLHAALIAFRALDSAPESIILQVIESYLAVHTAEYRIFAAWLLRNRDGAEAAGFVVRLLTDADHRVHHYASRLLLRQTWSPHLVQTACLALHGTALRAWHALNLLTILRRTDRLRNPGPAGIDAEMVRAAAMRWVKDANRAVRVAAYRTLAVHGAANEVARLLVEEHDQLVQTLAGRAGPTSD